MATPLEHLGHSALVDRCRTLEAANDRLTRQNNSIRTANHLLTAELENAEKCLRGVLQKNQKVCDSLSNVLNHITPNQPYNDTLLDLRQQIQQAQEPLQ